MTHQQARALGKKIHRAMLKIDASRSHPRTRVSWGGRLPSGMAPKLKPHHKSDIYAGMVRSKKQYEADDQPTHSTFRRVSDDSPAEAFIHPGIEARHFFEDAADFAGKLTEKLVYGMLRGMGA